MFGSGEKKSSKIDTLIGKNTTLEGTISVKGTVRLDGELKGDLHVEGSAIIGKDGLIKGNVYCNNIFISGTIEGNVDCKEQLRLTNTGKLLGDIQVKSFIVDENAMFEGKCQMQDSVNVKSKDKEKDSNKKKNKEEKGA